MKRVVSLMIVCLLFLSACTAGNTRQENTPMKKTPVPAEQTYAPSPSAEGATPSAVPAPSGSSGETHSGGKKLEGYKICIDPGHQAAGNKEKELCAPWSQEMKAKCTSGASGNFTKTEEYVLNLAIAQKLQQKLTELGAEVLMTRETHEVDISNKERAEAANRFGADITLRIHCNSAESEAAQGIELYVRGDGDGTADYRKQAEEDYRKASELMQFLCAETGANSRGVFRSDAYTGINWCSNTCIIVECGFLSNEKEDRLLNTAAYQDQIAEGIKNYFISSRESSDKNISGL